MSRGDDETEVSSNLPSVQPVGYGQPPVEHRFQKGKSGNPKGRPRKPKAQPLIREFGTQPANRLLMDEAYRPVTIREGERVSDIPMIQAVFRAMGVSAMKGNRFAQRTLAQLVQTVEQDDFRLRSELMQVAIDYKQGWTENIEWARANGVPEPQPLPHPDDIIIDLKTASVRWAGPCTPEEKKRWDGLLARRDQAQAEVNSYAAEYRDETCEEKKGWWLQEWHYEQRMFDTINDTMPERYKTNLEDRSWAKGASRAGDYTLEKLKATARRGRRPKP